ncbi:hypothetical protein COT77_01695 [Candidatus Berkelbacteria bacterium CG10_big_fil_rev_8_21_14_0_10_41_12]|uniref:Uncharacterized protein n=1 Tax=Candidatus Berkelbacteria bacterium CG10_big_fil_rev_8_21_14_0_10_41_12 TaxID=1974513 RepID=A0A2M6WXC4_9BACT|nr:MAG: hypothetical protein COT77_01695 [Candidatus Berkelbacteria bacterium CG10_big_fil_rev_8_21_14_0_10_41_12]
MFGLMPNGGNGGVYPATAGLQLGRGGIPPPNPFLFARLNACPSKFQRRRGRPEFFASGRRDTKISGEGIQKTNTKQNN